MNDNTFTFTEENVSAKAHAKLSRVLWAIAMVLLHVQRDTWCINKGFLVKGFALVFWSVLRW